MYQYETFGHIRAFRIVLQCEMLYILLASLVKTTHSNFKNENYFSTRQQRKQASIIYRTKYYLQNNVRIFQFYTFNIERSRQKARALCCDVISRVLRCIAGLRLMRATRGSRSSLYCYASLLLIHFDRRLCWFPFFTFKDLEVLINWYSGWPSRRISLLLGNFLRYFFPAKVLGSGGLAFCGSYAILTLKQCLFSP